MEEICIHTTEVQNTCKNYIRIYVILEIKYTNLKMLCKDIKQFCTLKKIICNNLNNSL